MLRGEKVGELMDNDELAELFGEAKEFSVQRQTAGGGD